MSDKYFYQEGAIHNDHKQVVNVTVSGKVDVGALIKGFFAKDAEDVQEVPSGETSVKTEIPDILCTPEAKALHTKLQQAGMLDAGMQPIGLSNAEKGLLAFELAGRLNIQNQWQVFATLWGTTSGSLRSAYNRAIEQRKTMLFIEKLKNILA